MEILFTGKLTNYKIVQAKKVLVTCSILQLVLNLLVEITQILQATALLTTSGLVNGRALWIYRILKKITHKQWIKDEYILNIG